MKSSILYCNSIDVNLKIGIDLCDITHEINEIIEESNIKNGVLSAFVVGSTGSITTIEYEPGVVNDLKKVINRLVPCNETYEHDLAWNDGNGHSHVQAALLGPSISIPIRNGSLMLGTWQQVVVINHDNRSRGRKIELTLNGTIE